MLFRSGWRYSRLLTQYRPVSEREPECLLEAIAHAEAAIYARIKQIPRARMDEAAKPAIDKALRAWGHLTKEPKLLRWLQHRALRRMRFNSFTRIEHRNVLPLIP